MSRQNPRPCQDIQDPRSYQDFQDPRSSQGGIQDLTKKFKMSRQNLRSFQYIQELKFFLRSSQDIQDVERWEGILFDKQTCLYLLRILLPLVFY